MYGVVDRIEENIAVIELDNESIKNIPLECIKGDVEEGDVLNFKDGIYTVDKEETQKRRREAESLLDLFK